MPILGAVGRRRPIGLLIDGLRSPAVAMARSQPVFARVGLVLTSHHTNLPGTFHRADRLTPWRNHVTSTRRTPILPVFEQLRFMYLVAIIDWYSRCVLSWRLSNSLESTFCVEALEDALTQQQPEIFNTDQGVQFVGGGQDRYRFGGGGRGGLPAVDVREWLVECGRPRGGRLFWKRTAVDW